MNDRTRKTRLSIYVGKGASHSWTWFVDLLERAGQYDVRFFDEHDVRGRKLLDRDALLVAGGDTFDLAEGLGEAGSKELEHFIAGGGYYAGSCAGAYLMLKSSKELVNLFNHVRVKIRNHVNELPPAQNGAAKSYPRYRCADIFHPVRDEVKVTFTGLDACQGPAEITVPLFGGPVMVPSGEASTLATYSGFTRKTIFLVNEELARDVVLTNAAAIRKGLGDGMIYLFGPHFEHPRYQAANRVVTRIVEAAARNGAGAARLPDPSTEPASSAGIDKLLMALKSEFSNSRIVAIALQRYRLSWPIGLKTYEPPKILHFLDAVWRRVPSLFEKNRLQDCRKVERILHRTRKITGLLRSMKLQVDDGGDTLHLAEELFPELRKMAARFLEYHFEGKLAAQQADEHRWRSPF